MKAIVCSSWWFVTCDGKSREVVEYDNIEDLKFKTRVIQRQLDSKWSSGNASYVRAKDFKSSFFERWSGKPAIADAVVVVHSCYGSYITRLYGDNLKSRALALTNSNQAYWVITRDEFNDNE